MKLAFFDAKPYDKKWFDKLNTKYEIVYFENKLTLTTTQLAKGCGAVCAFVNDEITAATIDALHEIGVKLIAMRCAGYNNVDVESAYGKINIVRVPAYSPHAIAEHAMALLLTLNRKLHRAYNRTRDFNFSLVGLSGMDLYGKTAGVVGTGQIGRVFISICRGFGMNVIAYDPYPVKDSDITYTDLNTIFKESHIISLHCPLTDQTKHILDAEAFSRMRTGVIIINTSRGALIDTAALLDSLSSEKVGGAGLDVYEEESDFFYQDLSGTIIKDDILALLVSRPNVLLTSHQAFLTEEALANIAETTLKNLDEFFNNDMLVNEICYLCDSGKVADNCRRTRVERCFK
ncbi:MAG: 2-hydroxyacid dehydrogenase [Oscillospiraceae bacterium]|nr:2-hydroxyacid dehydrogenase [Oscillospiraceae bacterium]